jgi:hypothetical protein
MRAIERATEPYQEHRYTAAELEADLTEMLHRWSEREDTLALAKLTGARRPARLLPQGSVGPERALR